MAPFWTASTEVSAANLERMGPVFDKSVGNDGYTTDLNQAYSDGHRIIALTGGAVLTANLTIAADGTCIFAPMAPSFGGSTVNLGSSYKITVTGRGVYLAGFRIGNVIEVQNDYFVGERLLSLSSGGHGFHFSSASDHGRLVGCDAKSATSDGIHTDASAENIQVIGGNVRDNGAYGINDLGDYNTFVGIVLANNTSGNKSLNTNSVSAALIER